MKMLEVSHLTLTEAEVELILEMRAEAAAKYRRDLLTVHILQVASEFEGWRQREGAGSSYSTFCDDFGYPGDRPEIKAISRSAIHTAVINLIAVAKNSSINIT